MELAQQQMEEAARAAADGAATRAGDPPALHTGDTGYFIVVEALGEPVKITLGRYTNIKVTTPDDMSVAEGFLAEREAAVTA